MAELRGQIPDPMEPDTPGGNGGDTRVAPGAELGQNLPGPPVTNRNHSIELPVPCDPSRL